MFLLSSFLSFFLKSRHIFPARFEFLLGILALVSQSSTLKQAGKKIPHTFKAPGTGTRKGGYRGQEKLGLKLCVRVSRERRLSPAWTPGKAVEISGAASQVLGGFRQSLGPFHKTSKLQGPDYPRHPQRVVRRDRVAQTPRSGTKLREPAGPKLAHPGAAVALRSPPPVPVPSPPGLTLSTRWWTRPKPGSTSSSRNASSDSSRRQ